VPAAGGQGLGYAELVGEGRFEIAVDAQAPLKDPKDYTIVGKSVARFDIPGSARASSSCRTSGCPVGCTHAWCGRRRSVPSCSPSTTPDAMPCPISSPPCARATSSPSSRKASGALSRPRARLRRTGPNGRGSRSRQDFGTGCDRSRSTRPRFFRKRGMLLPRLLHRGHASSPRVTTSRSRRTVRQAPPVRWLTIPTASSPPGALPGEPICCASSLRACSA
jgi:hypothetical protein